MSPGIGTYWHTVRHLRPVQIYGRIWRRVSRPRIDHRPAPALRATLVPRWTSPAARMPSMLAPTRFRFLGETRELAATGWDDPGLDRLWRYNLHYFDDLTARHAPARAEWHRVLIDRWIAENPPAAGTGWEPYPTSLRIVNWLKWSLAGNTPSAAMVQSVAVQARWLAGRLETHILGNHLFANAKALVFAGLAFDGAEAAQWLERGMDLLAREVPEQILGDGGQFERSPMYHALALEDVLDLCNLAAAAEAMSGRWRQDVAGWRARTPAMRHWLAAMCHPDGEISFFNDAAMGIAPCRTALEAYADRLGLDAAPPVRSGVTYLEPSGYVRLERGAAVALLDVGPVGPDYVPGHAHADTLSFELSLFGQRVIVNSGTSRYGTGAERARQRATAAHNTVVVDGADSSEVWSGFRVARRARTFALAVDDGPPPRVRCAHDGYRRLPGHPVHHREWTLELSSFVIADRIAGRAANAQARFHLHPDVAVTAKDGGVALTLPRGESVTLAVERGRCRVEDASWHPRFGADLPTRCVVVELEPNGALTRISWQAPS